MFINLTPHALNIRTTEGEILAIEPSGQVARVSETRYPLRVVEHEGHTFQVYDHTYGPVSGLPEPEEHTTYLVSGMVADACSGWRTDLLSPSDLIRNESGHPIGCDGLKDSSGPDITF